MTGGAPNNEGRVTTREFYDAQLETNKAIGEMERRVVGRLDTIAACLPGIENQVATNKDEIKLLRTRSNVNDIAVLVAGAVSSAIAAAIGWNK